jgi:DNA-directed RNA polymerase subunit alpha
MIEINIDNIKISKVSETANEGVFSIEPLPTGFGATLGNSLRRVLMTSIEGAAVTQVKIGGVTHQFTTIPGVKEDIVEITLNLKKLRFKMHTNNPVIATIKAKGPREITAADIEVSSDAEVINKDLHIATLANNKTELNMELIIERGMSYSPMEERQTNKIGVVVLDALFSPISNVTYEVESTLFGHRADLDKLILNIQTDGSISPEAALTESSNLLAGYFKHIAKGETSAEDESAEEVMVEAKPRNVENIAIEELPLQTRTINALKKQGIDSLQQLAKMSNEEIADIKNLGEKSLTEIKKLLEKEGYRK